MALNINSRRVAMLKLAGGVILLGFVIHFAGIKNMLLSLKNVRADLFTLSMLLSANVTLFRWWRWHVLVKAIMPAEYELSCRESLSSYLAGGAIGILTPGSIGEAARALVLKSGQTEAAGAVILERIFDLSISLVLCVPGLYLLTGTTLAAIWGAVSISFLLLLVYTSFAPAFVNNWINSRTNKHAETSSENSTNHIESPEASGAKRDETSSEGLANHIDRILQSWKSLSVSRRTGLIWRSILMYLFNYVTIWVLTIAFGARAVPEVILLIPLVYLVKLMPFSPNGLGLREAAAVTILGMSGVPPAAAINATLAAFTLNYGVPALAGVFILRNHIKHGTSQRS